MTLGGVITVPSNRVQSYALRNIIPFYARDELAYSNRNNSYGLHEKKNEKNDDNNARRSNIRYVRTPNNRRNRFFRSRRSDTRTNQTKTHLFPITDVVS